MFHAGFWLLNYGLNHELCGCPISLALMHAIIDDYANKE